MRWLCPYIHGDNCDDANDGADDDYDSYDDDEDDRCDNGGGDENVDDAGDY